MTSIQWAGTTRAKVESSKVVQPGTPTMRASFVLGSLLLTITQAAPAPAPSPPGVPSASTAKSELAALTVAAQGSQDGYSRDLFPHWIIQVRI